MKRTLRFAILGPVMAVWLALWLGCYPLFRLLDWLRDEDWDGDDYWSMYGDVWEGLTQ